MPDAQKALRDELIFQLNGGHAHAPLESVVRDFPEDKRGVAPKGLPYSGWQLLEHIRLAQRDILDFSTNEDGHYREPKWPDDYWPSSAQPPSAAAWEESVAAITGDRQSMCDLVASPERDLFAAFPWGSGQTMAREALVVVDHTSYHLGELLALRRFLHIWPEK